MLWVMSDKNSEVCKRIIKANLHSVMLDNLRWKSLSVTTMEVHDRPAKRTMVGLQVSILNNIMRRTESARQDLRQCQAVDVVQKFRQVENYSEITYGVSGVLSSVENWNFKYFQTSRIFTNLESSGFSW